MVIGKQGASAMADFLLGSVTRRLLARSTCDVMVVPRAAVDARCPRPAMVSQTKRLAASTDSRSVS
ncbi:MAG TPA: universal stress protein [Albitalea sp.]|uniref:universal stress protein n=1 Tax=Piscinibacter sp. TaxID=1903157 RepID=UPI002ED2DA38